MPKALDNYINDLLDDINNTNFHFRKLISLEEYGKLDVSEKNKCQEVSYQKGKVEYRLFNKAKVTKKDLEENIDEYLKFQQYDMFKQLNKDIGVIKSIMILWVIISIIGALYVFFLFSKI